MQSEIYNIRKPCAAYWTRHRAFPVFGDFERHIRSPVRRTHPCTLRNRTIANQTTKGHTKPHTIRTILLISEQCNLYAQTADISQSDKHSFFSPDPSPILPESPCKAVLFVRCLQFRLNNHFGNIHRKQISILRSDAENNYPPSFLTDRIGWIYI